MSQPSTLQPPAPDAKPGTPAVASSKKQADKAKLNKLPRSYTPSRRLFVALTALGLLSLGCFVWDWMALVWLGALVLLLVMLAFDWWSLKASKLVLEKSENSSQPTVQRAFFFTQKLLAYKPSHVKFNLQAIQSDVLYLKDVYPAVDLDNPEFLKATWEVTPKERGNQEWPGTLAFFRTPIGLLHFWQVLPAVPLKIYPRLNNSLQTLLDPKILLDQMGVKTSKFRRADQVFESLRPYVLGDNYRHIDWKATARTGGLVSRQFQMEHHHNILICLDSSRLMGTVTEGITKLDWAIEASLHLAYLAEHLHDKIGLAVFSKGIDRWVRPKNHAVESFLGSAFDVKSKIVEADLGQVCASVLATQKKRSLVIFLSDFLDPSSMQPYLSSFAHLNRKHCSLFIGIEDPAYKKLLDPKLEMNDADMITKRIVAQDSMDRRQVVLGQLRKLGLKAITVTPENLVQRAMQAYLEIKLSGAI